MWSRYERFMDGLHWLLVGLGSVGMIVFIVSVAADASNALTSACDKIEYGSFGYNWPLLGLLALLVMRLGLLVIFIAPALLCITAIYGVFQGFSVWTKEVSTPVIMAALCFVAAWRAMVCAGDNPAFYQSYVALTEALLAVGCMQLYAGWRIYNGETAEKRESGISIGTLLLFRTFFGVCGLFGFLFSTASNCLTLAQFGMLFTLFAVSGFMVSPYLCSVGQQKSDIAPVAS